MRVVSDTSPICYLFLIGKIEILPALFGRISIPPAVQGELESPRAPSDLQRWISGRPSWLEIHSVLQSAAADLDRLHAGEREAILLAEQVRADLLILDEKRARRIALQRRQEVTGLLGVLGMAAEQGLVSLPEAVEKLQQTSFRVEPKLLKLLLDQGV